MQTRTSHRTPAEPALNLRNGEVVEVRSKEEILATLNERGEMDSLPFMPEMLKFCGRRLTVYRRAIKFCDTKEWTGMHRMDSAVHLQGVRCDGSAHGGCQAGCMIFWKEAWLKRVDGAGSGTAAVPKDGGGCTEAALMAATRADQGRAAPGEERYSCQATELTRAAPVRLPWWDVRVYVRDVRAGNASALAMVRSVLVLLFNAFQAASRRYLPRPLRLIRGGQKFPFIAGTLDKTPKQTLDLQPGELVRVKTREQILATLDRNGRNRGLSFDGEMLKYCGQQARVLRRINRIIDEPTGKMLSFRGDCIVLEGVICAADYHQYCPRAIYPYWREIWLERVAPTPPDAG
jgi:predicted DNA-binding antitoxin AbrB/MazE fold protein